jgi:predicted protein tyrosine phosphatase
MASEEFVRFPITICGIDELANHCGRGVSHVLSILDPAAPQPPAFGSFVEHERVELRFDDVIDELPDRVVPSRHHVEQILAFGRDLMATPPSDAHLLVHCHMGISRSTAAMTLILAQACLDRSGSEILGEILRIRDRAWPNLRMLEYGDALLGRNGQIVGAVSSLYMRQLQRRPHLEQFFREGGRAREVELAFLRRSDA